MTTEWRCLAVSLTEAAADTRDIVNEPTFSTWVQDVYDIQYRITKYRIMNTIYKASINVV